MQETLGLVNFYLPSEQWTILHTKFFEVYDYVHHSQKKGSSISKILFYQKAFNLGSWSISSYFLNKFLFYKLIHSGEIYFCYCRNCGKFLAVAWSDWKFLIFNEYEILLLLSFRHIFSGLTVSFSRSKDLLLSQIECFWRKTITW